MYLIKYFVFGVKNVMHLSYPYKIIILVDMPRRVVPYYLISYMSYLVQKLFFNHYISFKSKMYFFL
jgi:hypothetical protein